MELGIYSKDGRLKLSVAPGDNGACSCGIQEESILAVSFTAFECIALEVYDYADFEGRRYWILERYLPQMNARREWTYSIRMSGAEGLAGQTLMVNPEDDDNPVLTLSAPAREHAALIVANMNRRTGTTEWKVGEVVVSEYIDIEYTGKYASDALSELSAAAKTEWWFDGMTLNISRCEFGECIPLSYGNGLIRNISRNIAEGVKFFTRLFPVGSSRNIDPDKYGHSRLQLPNGIRYVEQDTDLGIIEHFEQEAFERIFPRRIGTVGVVRHEERIGEDGKPFSVWYFTDPEIPFDPNQYEIGGLVKRVTFQSGELLGREFEVNYDSQKKEFEIITQWPYDDDMQLPSEPLIPASGDEYVLWNISMPESYYPAAEQEFKTAVDAFLSENRKDVSVFQAQTDFTVIDQRALDLRPGQRIRLESAEYFPDTGFRETRIVSISRSVVRPGSMTLKMSDVLSTGRISRIESNIASVERLTKQVSSEFPDIIRSWEETPASDTTLYSSRKSEREFLNKRRGGTVEADVIFDKDITIGGSVVSKDFRQGDFSGSGFGAYRDENGNAVLEADILKIRKEAIFNEAVINQVTFRVGATVFSNGGCEITRVEELETAFRCYYDNKEGRRYSGLTTGDQVRCQRYDPTQHAIIKYYWRLVTAVGEDYVELSKSDADGSASPEAGDEIAQFGNRSDITRQSAIVINPLDGGSVEVYAHIDAYSLSEKNYVGMGVNPQTGEAYMYAYGDMFFGDRDLADSKSSWITYQKKEGEERRRLRIKADVTFGADSSGLGNLSEFKAQQQQIDDARKEAEEAKREVAGIQIGGVNLLNDSETLQSWDKNTSYTNVAFEEYQGYKSAVITNSVGTYAGLFQYVSGLNVGDECMMSVWVFAEQPTTIHCGLQLYEYSISENEVGKWIRISHAQKAPSASKAFLCTASLTDASHKIAFRMAQLEAGNKVTAWTPSIADQEKYADEAVNGVETLIDASKLDQNTYYPVTIKLNGIARSKITVRVNLSDTQPGKPAWSTYNENQFSCQAVWYNNGNLWGSNYDKRVVEEYQHRYADGRPIGSVGQMTNSSNEYIYVRGGGVYRFLATNAGTPVLHTEAYTVDEQTVDIKTSVEPLVSLQEQANSTQQTADNAAAGVDSLKNFTDEAFADGIVDRAEAAAIGKYTNSVNETRKAADAAYAEIYGNPLLGGTAKSNLQAAKSAFDTAAADLLAAIATAADDGIASPGEQADVDAKYTLFNNAYGTFGTRLEEANKYMLTAVNTASQGALQLSQELQEVVNNINETILPDLQAQIDGSIVSWGGEEVPTLSNYPANQWTSDTERKRHIGDYYDRKTTVDGQAAYERYKFAFENNAYQWVRIADSGGAAAIATAREALGLAGTKARIFFGATTPAVPYSVNDVWFRSSGSGAALETTVYISNADKGQQETASAADWQLVDDSQVRLRQMSSDGVISREEKASLRNRLAQIQEAYTSYQNDAATYGVSIADLAAAYSALVNFLTGTVAVNNDTDTTLSTEQRSAYNAAFAAYDAEVSRFSNLVADAISQGKVDNIQVGGVNLLNDSETLQSWDKNTSYTNVAFEEYQGYKSAVITNSVGTYAGLFQYVSGLNVGDECMMSVWVFAEQPTTIHCGLQLYEYSISENEVGKWIRISHAQKAPSASKAFLCTASLTDASHKIAFRMAQLEAGNKVTAWTPSIADQEKYADEAVNGVETLIDASKLDQNTYYPVTIKLNGIARSKITVRVNLSDTQPGKPAWSTYNENQFSCQAVWYNNGNLWGSNYDKRVVEEYQHRYADGRPIGSVGQMTNSSNEYIYVRGGGVYRFLATNAGTPVLHTEAYTVDEQTVDIKTSVEPLVSLQEQANSTQQEAETTRQAIADMNDDTIFDVSEKQSIRTQWENISGYARTDVALDSLSATNGSYYRVRDMAKAAGISTAGLLAAVNSLRVKLNDYALYTASNTPGFDRAGLAVLFTAYYAQEIDVLNAVSQKYTDGKVADIETSMKDYDYLKLVFPNNTVDNNGVFLSRLMAVKNGTSASAAVVAGLYGGGVDSLNNAGFKDATHGILMMFAGATSIQNVAAAKTRIYGDGSLFTKALYADGGEIGGFTITERALTATHQVGAASASDLYLSYDLIRFLSSSEKTAVYMGASSSLPPSAFPNTICPVRIENIGSDSKKRYGIYLDVTNGTEGIALMVANGRFSGFRPMSRSYDNGTYTLKGNEEETVFFVNTSKGSTTFYLPSNPQPDQRYEIRKLHSGNSIIINAQNNGDIYVTGSNNPSSQISWTGRRCVTIQYSKNLDAWVMWFSYEA
jgi:hypothetical protein